MNSIYFTLVLLLSDGNVIQSEPLPSSTICVEMLAQQMSSYNVVMGQCIRTEHSIVTSVGKERI